MSATDDIDIAIISNHVSDTPELCQNG